MTENILLSLIKNELWNDELPADIPQKEINRLLAEANSQSVVGMAINSLIRNNIVMDRATVLKAVALLSNIKKINEKHYGELKDFAEKLNAKDIGYVVVKGQTISELYPNPNVRIAGDIDFLCYDKNYDDIKAELEDLLCIKLPKIIIEKEVAFTRNGILYEFHKDLIIFRYKKHNDFWMKELNKSLAAKHFSDNSGVCILEPTINVAYVFAHLFFHFIKGGIGLRHLCDMAVMLHHYKNDIDKERLESILKGTGIFNAFIAFGSVLIDYIGLPKNEFPFDISCKYEKKGKLIMTHVLKVGNFGRKSRKTKSVGFKYKMETALYILKNSIKYFNLAPWEMTMLFPWTIKENLRIYWHENKR